MEATNETVRKGSNFPNLTVIGPVLTEQATGTFMQVKGKSRKRRERIKVLEEVG